MRGLEAWVTTAVEDKDVSKVLVLASSLRRSMTTKHLVVLASPTLDPKKRSLMNKAFDQVLTLDHHSVNGWISLKDYAKLYGFNLTLFQKCVYLAPETLVLKNSDELFDLPNDFNAAVSYSNDGSIIVDTCVFCFTPSVELFEHFMTYGKKYIKEHAGHFDTYMKDWLLNQKGFGKLNEKYNFQLSTENVSTRDFSIAKFPVDVSEKLVSSGLLQYDGIIESGIVKYWKDLFEQKVFAEPSDVKLESICRSVSSTTLVESNSELLDSIAIVGLSCRHAGANNIGEFWDMLINGHSGINTVPMDRWTNEHGCKASAAYESTLGGFISPPVDEFDSKFFGISPKEMEFLDPQQRLLLEVTWEALENAGIDPLGLYRSHSGIFLGALMYDYKDLLTNANCDEFYRMYMGNSFGAAAARLSFFLGLTGPSVATESGCSSAMQAVDLACKSLRNKETSMALACGVNLLLRPFNKDTMSFVIAGDGRCKTFDAQADGFGRAEGCGVLVLKRYTDAVKDGNHIWAVIRGSSCVQEGVSRSMGTPTKECEALAMSLALKNAGVHPKDVSFVEAHGTGTALGDPLEISAITEVYGGVERKEPLIVGSVKTNVGHTESCSAITGIIKVIASLQHEVIPPHLNLKELNPKINLNAIPARIPLEAIPWPKYNAPRIAGINSFGITGTDGSLILQETPSEFSKECFLSSNCFQIDRPLHIMKLSARSEKALETMLNQYQEYLRDQTNFPDICYTSNSGRANFAHRAVVIARDCQEACEILQAKKYCKNDAQEGEGTPGKICFLFTRQGSQYTGMAKQLYETSPVFRMNFDKCHKILLQKFGLDMKTLMFNNSEGFELSRSLYSQTSIFCVEYCLLKLWESWGVHPDYVLGHSLGEFCAALAAGFLTFEDALTLVAERSILTDNLAKGSMLVIKANLEEVEKLMQASKITLDIAAVNSQQQTVVAGDTEKVMQLSNICKENGMKATVLEASHAFHSRHMDQMLEKYRKIAETVCPSRKGGKCQYISGMEGRLLEDPCSELDSDYWVRHTRESVSFLDACKVLQQLDCQQFLEIGPQPILSALVIANTNTEGKTLCIPSIRKNQCNWQTILNSLAKLYTSGWPINWGNAGFDKFYKRSIVSTLPTYPFQRKKHWFDTQNMKGIGTSFMNETLHPLLGCMIPNASGAKIFQNAVDVRKRVEWIKDHCVGKTIIFPGAGFLEMCLSAGHCVTESLTDTFCKPSGPLTIENLKILAPLALDENLVCQMQTVLQNNLKQENSTGDAQDGMKIQIFRQHWEDGETPKWTEHCVSYFTPTPPVDFDEIRFRHTFNFENIQQQCQTQVSIADLYEKLAEVGLRFGTSFQSLTSVWKGETGILAKVKVPVGEKNFIVHPVLLDAMLQAAMVVQNKGQQINSLHVPIAIKKFTWLQHDDTDSDGDPSKYFIYSCFYQQSTNTPNTLAEQNLPNEIISVLFSGNEETGNKIIGFMIGMEFAETTVQALESHLDSQKTDIPALHNEVWKPQLGPYQARAIMSDIFKMEIIVNDKVMELFEDSNILLPCEKQREDFLQKLCYGYVLNAFFELGWNPKVGDSFLLDKFLLDLKISPQHKKLVRYHMTMLEDEGILAFISDMELKVIQMPPLVLEVQQLIRDTQRKLEGFDHLENALQIYNSCGSIFAPILQGKSSALPILFPQDPTKASAESFYTESYSYSGMDISTIKNFKTLMKPYDTNSKAILRILEVGAGTGNFTRDILNIFREYGIGIEYTFTDISPAFFINASKKFEDFKDVIKYQVLNVEHDAKLQGFSTNYFDIVVGADVFHATKSLSDSISNVRQLLRPGGLLCLIEGARPNHITCVFGLLEGYWRFVDTDIRQHHPLVTGDTWKSLCLNLGFDHAIAIPHVDNYYTFVIARASEDEPRITRPIVYSTGGKWLVFPTLDNESKFLVSKLSLYRQVITVWRSVSYQESEDGFGFGINVNQKEHMTKMMTAVRNQSNTSYIEGILYLWGLSSGTNTDQAEIAQPFLNLCQAIVEMKQTQMPKFLMVTHGIYSIGDHLCENPAGSTLWGIAKSCANELNMKIKMIDISPAKSLAGSQEGAENANDIFYELWNDVPDLFVAYREKARYFSRLMKTKLTEKPLKLPQSDRFHLILPQTKAIADLKFGTLGKYSLKPDEIEVQLKSCAI